MPFMRTALWKDPYLVLHVNQQDKPSGFLPRYGRYEVFSSTFSTHLDRVIVITSHLSLPALPHNTSPSKRRTLLTVFMANELS